MRRTGQIVGTVGLRDCPTPGTGTSRGTQRESLLTRTSSPGGTLSLDPGETLSLKVLPISGKKQRIQTQNQIRVL